VILCDYGCGLWAKYWSKHGRPRCEKIYQRCPVHRKSRKIIMLRVMKDKDVRKKISDSKKNLSDETRAKISAAQKGRIPWNKDKTGIYSEQTLLKMSNSSKGHPGVWQGKKRSEETIRKIKENHADMSMERNPNWRGGISFEPYCADWTREYKEYVKGRDGYKCLNPDCWQTFKELSIHHIDYNKKNCGPSNLITLCNSCNSRANTDRDWHEFWYKAIIYRRYGEEKDD